MTVLSSTHQGVFGAHQAVTVDVVLFAIQDRGLKVLLIKRDRAPFAGQWALPGGFVHREESVDAAALRELQDKTNVDNVYLEQLYTFGDPGRDPRGRVMTVAYYALVNWAQYEVKARSGIRQVKWFPVKRLPALAFDHRRIMEYALERLRNKVNYTSAAFQLLPKRFTLTALQQAYEVILGTPLDKRNFRKKMVQLNVLRDTGQRSAEGRQRPAKLYAFTNTKVIKLQEKGIIVPF